MSIPSNPTLTALVTEGINQAGESNPSASLISRASSEWIPEILNDIWHLAKKPKILQQTAYTIMNQGQSRYAYPLDYSSDLQLMILDGTDTGICQAGTASSLTLSATDNSGNNIIGKEILMTAGTSFGSYAQIVAYDSTTKVASVIPNFNTTPVVGDTYMIVDVEYPVITKPIYEWERNYKLISPMLPQYLYPLGDDDEGYFVLNAPPDKQYGARLRYYVDITRMDQTTSLFSTILRRWRNILVQGIRSKKLSDEDDTRQEQAKADYARALQNMIYREIYGMDISTMTDKISDYY